MSAAARARAVGASLLVLAASARAEEPAAVAEAPAARPASSADAPARAGGARGAQASRKPPPAIIMIPLVGLALLPFTLPVAEPRANVPPAPRAPAPAAPTAHPEAGPAAGAVAPAVTPVAAAPAALPPAAAPAVAGVGP